MALWGNADKLTTSNTQASTVAVASGGAVTGVATKFQTDLNVGDYLLLGGHKYSVATITSDTAATVTTADASRGTTVPVAQANVNYVIQQCPKSIVHSEGLSSNNGISGDADVVFGVNPTETGVSNSSQSFTHAGWVRRTVGAGGRSGRIQTEVLVAMSSIAGDAADDSEVPDS